MLNAAVRHTQTQPGLYTQVPAVSNRHHQRRNTYATTRAPPAVMLYDIGVAYLNPVLHC